MSIVFLITRSKELFKTEGVLHLLAQCIQHQKGVTYYFVAPALLKPFTPEGCQYKKWPSVLSYLPFGWGWTLFKQFSSLQKSHVLNVVNPAMHEKIVATPLLAPCYSLSSFPHPALQFYVLGQLPTEKEFLYLLKAFSLFKKRQQSSMKLVLSASSLLFIPSFKEKLSTYKYRNAVEILPLNTLEEQMKEESISFAFIALDPQGDYSIWQQKAVQLKVPLLINQTAAPNSTTDLPLLPFSAEVVQSLADQMMLIYKDENLRSNLINTTSSQPACVSLSSHPIYYEYLYDTN